MMFVTMITIARANLDQRLLGKESVGETLEIDEPAERRRSTNVVDCHTDGTQYLPRDMLGQTHTWESSPADCQRRCQEVPGCRYWMSFPAGTCHITDGSGGTTIHLNNPTLMSGLASCGCLSRDLPPSPCYTITDRTQCLSTTESRSQIIDGVQIFGTDCIWCPNGCGGLNTARCEPKNWSEAKGHTFEECAGDLPSTWDLCAGGMIQRTCPYCAESHRTIVYKRKTDGTAIDFEKLFLDNWVEKPAGGSNKMHIDFELFSSEADAKSDNKPWLFCNYDKTYVGVGFPRDCGMVNPSSFQWNSRMSSFQYNQKGVTWRMINSGC